MAQPLAGYWTLPIIASYLTEINPANDPYQERIDQLWLNILTHYFPLRDDLGTEREAHVEPGRMFAVNVAVTNIRQNHMHKVIVVEAKAFPHNTDNGWFNRYPWTEVEGELKFYMEKIRQNFGNVQTMYGIAAVGDMVRFYRMNSQNNPGHALTPFTSAGQLLNVHTDAVTIHAILTTMSAQIRAGINTY
ncbi:hypothetical protein Aspvir_002379 [Aspergillus viridinutans]|uniref:Uncharacterized protein n=1 Tax=Aspergillus viridinutans TaxID=75553 RepID=A0A9P3CAJ8_ASPVI|nr:uncharacterized protein Aspvir_002379 [Aspergillus viridinutans]GIK06729.1 hypothetical protein Aspvir_002379 [Aspergillus viridinutans]